MALDRHIPGEQFKKPQPEPVPARFPRVYPGDKGYRPAPLSASPRAAAPPAIHLGPDWRLILNENFAASNVDMTRWWTRYVYQDGTLDYLNDEWQRYRESGNHAIDKGILGLTALPYDANQGFWPSGMLRSKDCYPLADGNQWYIEARLKVPQFLGAWTGFWLAGSEREAGNDQSIPWPPEIDIAEIVDNGSEDTTHMLHCGAQVLDWDRNPQGYAGTWYADGFDQQWMYYWSESNLAAEFHRYGLSYQRPEMVVYLDRQPIMAATYDWVADDGQPMPGAYLLCNLAVGGSWAGRNGVDNTALPDALDADYLRLYTRIPQSTIGHDLLPR